MHRRARHLNPGSAGAVLALDSRFISGLNDGDAVTTWEDRTNSNNDATQGTSAARPSYQTAEQGGQPGVLFSSANSQVLKLTTAFYPSSGYSIFAVMKTTGAKLASLASSVGGNGVPFGPFTFNGTMNVGNRANYASVSDGNTVFAIYANNNSSSNVLSLWKNGSPVSLSPINLATSGNFTDVGSRTGNGDYGSGYISQVTVMSSVMAASLRRRLEHAAAFSFKIACS
jgi:hypothetical protein